MSAAERVKVLARAYSEAWYRAEMCRADVRRGVRGAAARVARYERRQEVLMKKIVALKEGRDDDDQPAGS